MFDTVRNRIVVNITNYSFLFIVMSIAPLVILKPNYLLNDSTLYGFASSRGPTDIFGLYRWSQIFNFGISPLGLSFYTNYPEGDYLFTKESISQVFQLFFVKLLNLIFSANQSVNILTFINWVLIGTSVFTLTSLTNLPKYMSLLCGVYCQIQPSIIQASLSLPSMMYVYIPIYAIYFYSKQTMGLSKSLNVAIIIFTFTIFIDLYLYYFSLLILTLLIMIQFFSKFKSRSNLQPLSYRYLLILPYLPLLFIHLYSNYQKTSTGGRRLEPVSKSILDSNGMQISDYFKPIQASIRDDLNCPLLCESNYSLLTYGNMGLGFVVLSIFALSFALFKSKFDILVKQLSIVSLTILFLTLKSQFMFGELVFPNLISELRYLMLGALYLERIVIILVIFLIIIVFVVFEYVLTNNLSRRLFFPITIIFIVMLNYLDTFTPALKLVNKEQINYVKINQSLDLDEASSILFLPNSFFGRNWLEQVYLGLPMANSLFDGYAIEDLNAETALGFACKLDALKISHVLSVTDIRQNLFVNNIQLVNTMFFDKLSSQLVNGYENDVARMTIFAVKCPKKN